MTTWGNIEAISKALTEYINTGKLTYLQLTDFTRALKDLRGTVENVINNININNGTINNIVPTHEMKKETIMEYVQKSFTDEDKEQLKEIL
jgi:hypothetical protein